MKKIKLFEIMATTLCFVGCIATALVVVWCLLFLWWTAVEATDGPTYPGSILSNGTTFWWIILFIPLLGLYIFRPVRRNVNRLFPIYWTRLIL